MIKDLLRRIEAIGSGKRLRLATLRRDVPDPGPELGDPILFAALVESEPRLRRLLFLSRDGSWWRRRFGEEERERAVLDLSNVAWTIGATEAGSIGLLVELLGELGVERCIGVADANLPHRISDFDRLHQLLDELLVVDGGTPADPTVLDRAEQEGALIVSNDRFRDWKKSSAWRRRNIERLRCPLSYLLGSDGSPVIDLGLAEDELRFDRDPAGRYDTE